MIGKILLSIWLIFLLTLCIVEVIILGTVYLNADSIKCNFLWCEFTSERGTFSINQKCYLNDVLINCSEIDNKYISRGKNERKEIETNQKESTY